MDIGSDWCIDRSLCQLGRLYRVAQNKTTSKKCDCVTDADFAAKFLGINQEIFCNIF